eukprot:5790532-Prymnesium_polylepis.1
MFCMMFTGLALPTGSRSAARNRFTGRSAQTIADWIPAWRSVISMPLSTSIRLRCITRRVYRGWVAG